VAAREPAQREIAVKAFREFPFDQDLSGLPIDPAQQEGVDTGAAVSPASPRKVQIFDLFEDRTV
jgi:hypothetical protein